MPKNRPVPGKGHHFYENTANSNAARKARGWQRKNGGKAVPKAKPLAWYEEIAWEPKPPPGPSLFRLTGPEPFSTGLETVGHQRRRIDVLWIVSVSLNQRPATRGLSSQKSNVKKGSPRAVFLCSSGAVRRLRRKSAAGRWFGHTVQRRDGRTGGVFEEIIKRDPENG
jgi:hypothetical protein